MTQAIYDKHRKAFGNVSAYVVTNDRGERVATIAIKYGARVTAFTHYLGIPMTSGFSGGGGYDRESAAIYEGFAKVKVFEPKATRQDWQETPEYLARESATQRDLDAFRKALTTSDGSHWHQNLGRNGFTVMQAV
jgi:hypothetical protein